MPTGEIENYKMAKLIDFLTSCLKRRNCNLDLQSLKNEKVYGLDFLKTSKEEFHRYGIPYSLWEEKLRPFLSYHSLKEVLSDALNIAREVTCKEFNMRPEYEVIGDESRGRVDYAIKKADPSYMYDRRQGPK
ncbi:hypothetical protein RhiirC2_793508 [Rhizophagus irregularis]|uniref:Uncharacterized protein n=1 Tax=Rhizophagus irregularis TaxID=588596 RepID=A0A2N1MFB4_9GLOM|nr:hypothetical protein RhiirC2_793508 [Rhizophagus irregularis]